MTPAVVAVAVAVSCLNGWMVEASAVQMLDSEVLEVICSSPQGSVIEIPQADSSVVNMEETQNQSHITLSSTDLDQSEKERARNAIQELDEFEFASSYSQNTPKKQSLPINSIVSRPNSIVSSPEVPSAQLTSFRLRSPVKRLSPLRKKLNLLVTQESFSVPNLMQSSPTSSLYCTARDGEQVEETQYEQVVSEVEFKGAKVIQLEDNTDKNYKTRVIPFKRSINSIAEEEDEDVNAEEIPQSSEDEGEVSLIEITRRVKKPKTSGVLQVVSSPTFDNLQSSPITSPSKYGNVPDRDNPFEISTNDITDLGELQKLQQIYSDSVDMEEGINEDDKANDDDDDDFQNMSMNQLRQKIMEYGLKPSNSKLKMIESLKNLFQKIQPETKLRLTQSQTQPTQQLGINVIKNSQNLIKFDIYDTLNQKFLVLKKGSTKAHRKLYEKIYTFQPINKSELRKFFKKELNDSDNDEMILKKWCDWNSICLVENDEE